MSESDSDDVPLLVRRNRRQKAPVSRKVVESPSSEPSDDSSEDDNVPLTARQNSRMKRKRPEPPSEVKEPTARQRTPAKKETGSALKKKPVKKASQVKKETEASSPPKKVRKTAKAAKKETTVKAEDEIMPKAKTKRTSTAKAKKEEDVVRKFEMPGQRRETPPENDPLRLFYKSMYDEKIALKKPRELGETWLLRHGLLEEKVAFKVLARLGK